MLDSIKDWIKETWSAYIEALCDMILFFWFMIKVILFVGVHLAILALVVAGIKAVFFGG